MKIAVVTDSTAYLNKEQVENLREVPDNFAASGRRIG